MKWQNTSLSPASVASIFSITVKAPTSEAINTARTRVRRGWRSFFMFAMEVQKDA